MRPGTTALSRDQALLQAWLPTLVLILLTLLVAAAPLRAEASPASADAKAEPAADVSAAATDAPVDAVQESAASGAAHDTEQAKTPVLERIAVTARRYREYLQLVPASLNVMTSKYLQAQGLANVREIVDFAPGGWSTAFNKMQEEYSLRGIGSLTEGASGDSSVATVIDDVAISREFMKSQSFFDMEVVEILRGPQGTAFGRNASSGLIHLKSARPTWDFGSSLVAELGSHDTYGVEGFVTGRLSERAAGRLALRANNIGGYTEDTRTGNLLGGTRNLGLRGSLLFEPSSAVRVFFKAELNNDNDSDPSPRKGKDCTIAYQGDFPDPSIVGAPQPPWTQFPNWFDSCDPWKTTVSSPTYLGDFFLDRHILNLTNQVEWEVGNDLVVTAVTGYLEGNSDYLIDAHGGPNNSMFQSTQNDAWQLSQEVRIDNHSSLSRLRYLAGLYLLSDNQTRDDANIFYVDNAVSDPQDPSGFRPESRDIKQQNNETTSWGLFAELSYDLSDKLTATLGGRASHDHKKYSVAHYGWGWGGPIAGLTNGIDSDGDGIADERCVFNPGGPPDFGQRFCGSPQDPVGFETPVPTTGSWSNLSFKGSMSYVFSDTAMTYGLISQGYKTGGFQNEPLNPIDAIVPYDQETALNYEVGARKTFGERFQLNVSAFFTRYKDLQLFLFLNTPSGDYFQLTSNAAGADVKGIELDYLWQATKRLLVSGTYARLSSELTDALIDTDGDFVLEDFSGTRPGSSPEWTGTAVAEYTLPLESGASLSLRGDWRGISDVYYGIGEDPARRHDGYGVVGTRISWIPSGAQWSVSLWVRNLLQEEYTTNVGPYQPNLNQLNYFRGAPRTFGISLRRFLF